MKLTNYRDCPHGRLLSAVLDGTLAKPLEGFSELSVVDWLDLLRSRLAIFGSQRSTSKNFAPSCARLFSDRVTTRSPLQAEVRPHTRAIAGLRKDSGNLSRDLSEGFVMSRLL